MKRSGDPIAELSDVSPAKFKKSEEMDSTSTNDKENRASNIAWEFSETVDEITIEFFGLECYREEDYSCIVHTNTVQFRTPDKPVLILNLLNPVRTDPEFVKDGGTFTVTLKKETPGTWTTLTAPEDWSSVVPEAKTPVQGKTSDSFALPRRTQFTPPRSKTSSETIDNMDDDREAGGSESTGSIDSISAFGIVPVWVSSSSAISIDGDGAAYLPNMQGLADTDFKRQLHQKTHDVCASLYLKATSDVKVHYQEKQFTIEFRSQDSHLRQLYPKADDSTRFFWTADLKYPVDPDHCNHTLSPSKIEISLRTNQSQHWDVLLARPGPVRIPAPQLSPGRMAADAAIKREAINRTFINNSDSRTKTPTKQVCVVTPQQQRATSWISGSYSQQDVERGHIGLDNLGNTCFLNSVVQSLSNTREFRDYFLDKRYVPELNTNNPLGFDGALAKCFADLLHELWNGKRRSVAPYQIKGIISQKAVQFTGFAQHDAQEFMAFLLDGLHEDLNRVQVKPYAAAPDDEDALKTDEEKANDAWALYKKRNDSIVVDLYQGQFKSKLVCPVCDKVSITFDPFLYLSVPLPKKKVDFRVVYTTTDVTVTPVSHFFRLKFDAKVLDLKTELCNTVKAPINQVRLYLFPVPQPYRNQSCPIEMKDEHSLDLMPPNSTIYAYQVWNPDDAGEETEIIVVIQRGLATRPAEWKCVQCQKPDVSSVHIRCEKCLKTNYCSQECKDEHWKWSHKDRCRWDANLVGKPFVISMPRSQTTFSNICRLMEDFSKHTVNLFCPPNWSSRSAGCSPAPPPSSPLVPSEMPGGKPRCSASATSADEVPPLEPMARSLSSQPANIWKKPQSPAFVDNSLCNGDMPSDLDSKPGCSVRAQPIPNPEQGDASSDQACMPAPNPKMPVLSPEVDDFSRLTLSPSCKLTAPKRAVMGHSAKGGQPAQMPFRVQKIGQDSDLLRVDETRLVADLGEEPLIGETRDFKYLAMDWKNDEKFEYGVYVETKTDEELKYGPGTEPPSATEDTYWSLSQCLELFTEPETLSADEAWYCPDCKEHRQARKQLGLWQVPPMLIIQLKRFSFKSLMYRDKIDKMVKCPLSELDLTPYCCGPIDVPPKYDLYAVVNHHGGILGGHYTCYSRLLDSNNNAKDDISWRCFDDSHVTSIPTDRVMTSSAYVLFYRHRQMAVSLPAVPTAEELIKLEEQTKAPDGSSGGVSMPRTELQKFFGATKVKKMDGNDSAGSSPQRTSDEDEGVQVEPGASDAHEMD